jgi:hypothetical protein
LLVAALALVGFRGLLAGLVALLFALRLFTFLGSVLLAFAAVLVYLIPSLRALTVLFVALSLSLSALRSSLLLFVFTGFRLGFFARLLRLLLLALTFVTA